MDYIKAIKGQLIQNHQEYLKDAQKPKNDHYTLKNGHMIDPDIWGTISKELKKIKER